jgi:hypothetical protein
MGIEGQLVGRKGVWDNLAMAREFCKVCFDPRVRDLEKVLGRGVPLRIVARLSPWARGHHDG